MNKTLAIVLATACVLAAGTVGASARHYHTAPGYGSYGYAGTFGYGRAYNGHCSRRVINQYINDPPGGIVQDRSYQESVLGLPAC